MEQRVSWSYAEIDKLISNSGVFCDGDWIESKDQDPNGDVRLIQLADIGDGSFRSKSARFLTTQRAKELNCTFLKEGDLLIARMPEPIGRCCKFPLSGENKFVTAVDVAIIRLDTSKMSAEYLMHAVNNPQKRNQIEGLQSGTTRKRISRKNLSTIKFPIAPLPEQRAIVAKIERLFSELDDGISNLKKAQEQLKIYRQAVLTKAFEGELTKQWREQRDLPIAKKLTLEKITIPKTGLRRGPFGSAIKKSFFTPKGYKVYEQGNAINDDPFRGSYYISKDKFEELRNFEVLPGDLLVSCSGSLGRIVKIPDDAEKGVINQALLRIRLNQGLIDAVFFIHLFRSAQFQKLIFENSLGSAMSNLVGIKKFKETPIGVPSLEEQKQIVQEIETRLSVCDNMEANIKEALFKAKALRQSILKKAFEGKLLNDQELEEVRRSPDWQPAEKLLERVKADKLTSKKEKVYH